MKWSDVAQKFPSQWLLIEALEAHSDSEHRILDRVSVVETFPGSREAMSYYCDLHHREPSREYYVLHTDRRDPDIRERPSYGVRGSR